MQMCGSNVFIKTLDLCASAHTRLCLALILTDKSQTEIRPGLSAAQFSGHCLPVYLSFYHDYVEGRGTMISIFGSWKFEKDADELEK